MLCLSSCKTVEENHSSDAAYRAFNSAQAKLLALKKQFFFGPSLSGCTEFSKHHNVVKNALLIRLPLANVPNSG